MAGAKRKLPEVRSGEEEEEEQGEEQEERSSALVMTSSSGGKRRKLEFQDVTVFHFNRRQGFVCVPSQVCCSTPTHTCAT